MNIYIEKSTLFATTILSLGLLSIAPAAAQAGAVDEDQGGIREIVVTARKVSENLQTTPVAVTALDTTALQQRQITSVAQIVQAAPSLSIQIGGTGNSGLAYVAIRGNAQNSPNSATDAAVGIYVDGVYYGRPMIGNLGLLDLASAEVLRGTQGTLFGRNTTGGALNLTTVVPGGELTGYIRGTLGNRDFRSVEGAVTLPLNGDELSLRVAGRYSERGPLGKNPLRAVDPETIKHDINARATLRFAPAGSPLEIIIRGDIIRTKDSYNNSALTAVNPTGASAGLYASQNISQYLQSQGNNFYRNYSNPQTGSDNVDSPWNHNRAEGVSGTIEYDLGGAQIKSITAWRHSNTGDQADIDGTPVPVISYGSDYVQRQFSEELQISGKVDRLDWIFGGMYFRESGHEQTESYPFQKTDLKFLALNPAFGPNYANGQIAPSTFGFSNFKSSSRALFAQANYELTDSLRATAGFRYTWDTRSIVRRGINNATSAPEYIITPVASLGFPVRVVQPGTCQVGVNAGTVAGDACAQPLSAKFKYPAWTLGLDYQMGDGKFIYAKTGGAAMAGGFNTRQTPPGFGSFKPEKVKDAEIGFKGDFLDRRLRVNLAGFYVWRNDAQNIVNLFANGALTQFVQNAGKVRSHGIELETTAQPWEGMELNVAASRLWSKYKAGSFTGVSGVTGMTIDRSGEEVLQAPKWIYNVAATQRIPYSGGELVASMNYAYQGSRAMCNDTPDLTYGTSATNPADTAAKRAADYAVYNQQCKLKGYGLLNGRIGLELNNGIELSIWGKNLLETHYYVSQFNGYLSLGQSIKFQGAPQTFGATIGYKF
ncbi:TonB-dependent receptor [Sphingobium baderi]|uniref:TonB-dependent receptor n=1 Tax=Sphingobium baderi TaxID=1332080 RepID=A0A0S3EYA8_9SPHN|nr:TonB-dependent receptor [Sphingobium baderi]ALR20419.1 TonB-dependent receptor [Sphingobium baderi]